MYRLQPQLAVKKHLRRSGIFHADSAYFSRLRAFASNYTEIVIPKFAPDQVQHATRQRQASHRRKEGKLRGISGKY